MADEPYGDDDPRMREYALEDDFYTGAVHDGVRVIDHVHPCGLMRVDVAGDLRASVVDAVALSAQAHRFVEVRLGFFEMENFCSFHGEILLHWGNFANPSIYRSIGDDFGDAKTRCFENSTGRRFRNRDGIFNLRKWL